MSFKAKRSKKTHSTTIFSFSHSGVDCMEKCTREWYLKYIKKIYPKTIQPATQFGSFLHEIAENYRGNGIQEIRQLQDKFKSKYVINDVYEAKINLAVANFMNFYHDYLENASTIYREKEIRIALNEYVDLVGNIDCLYRNSNNEWVVVDYKTSKKVSDCSKQLSLYYFLMCAISKKKPKKLKCQIVYLALEDKSYPIVDEYVLTQDELDFCESRLESAMNRLQNLGVEKMSAWRKKPGHLCNYCDYFLTGYCDGKNKESSC